jgi:predicted nucleic acid-binding protein
VPVLLDTTVLIDLLRGRGDAVARLGELHDAGERLFTTVVNVEEIHRGLRSVREREAAACLLGGLRLAPLGRAEGARAGGWRREHAEAGVTLSQADCLIAAGALAVGARVATGNPRHFPMRGVTVVHWPAGA